MTKRGVKKGSRFGRRERGGQPVKTSPVGPQTELSELMTRIRAESPLKADAAKEVAVRVLTALMVEQQRLAGMSADGTITSEEAKSVSANASNIRRWFESLGVTEHRDPGDEGEL